MVHLRIVVPPDRSAQVVGLLEASPSASNLVVMPGVARKPAGDLVLCDVAREQASMVIDDLKRLGVGRDGSIALEQIDSQVSSAADRAERAGHGTAAEGVVWESVEARTSESVELSGTFVAFIVLACLLASVGIFTGSPILIVGAMILGPEFGPLAGLCVAAVERRRDLARRSLTALVVGFPLAIAAAFLFTLLAVAIGLVDADFHSSDNPLTEFIAHPDWFSFFVAAFAGIAGLLSLTAAKSGALIGVVVSVTTIPAAANIGVAAALGNWSDWAGAMAQLSLNLVTIFVAGLLTLALQRRVFERRRQRHQVEGAT